MPPTSPSQLAVLQCALAMLVSAMFFGLLDSTAKFLTELYPLWQVVFIRYASHLILFALFLTLTGRLKKNLRTSRPKLQLIRSCLLIATTATFFLGLRYLPLTEAIAMMLLTPLIVSVLAIPMLGESLGKHRVISVLLGLCGAMIVFRPGTELFQPAALLVLVSAFLYALYQIATRMLANSDSVATTTLYTAVVGTVVAGIIAPLNWQTIETQHLIFACTIGIHAILSHGAIIIAFSLAPASLATAFGYSNVLWAALFSLIFFDHLPDGLSWTGIIIIVVSGIYLLWRETHHKLPPTPLQRLPVPTEEIKVATAEKVRAQGKS